MRIAQTLGVGICRVLQGIVTLGVMVVIPIGWFFFGWNGPLAGWIGRGFIWRVGDCVLWMLSGIAAMFATTALETVIARLSASPARPVAQAPPPSPGMMAAPVRRQAPSDAGEAATIPDTNDPLDDEVSDDEPLSGEAAYYGEVEAYVTKMGWHHRLLTLQATDREFAIAAWKVYRAGYLTGQPTSVVGALMMESVNRYEPDRRLALYFMKALEEGFHEKKP